MACAEAGPPHSQYFCQCPWVSRPCASKHWCHRSNLPMLCKYNCMGLLLSRTYCHPPSMVELCADHPQTRQEAQEPCLNSPAWLLVINVNVTAPASCRMFPAGRQALWEEKLGLAPKFAGNAATRWGTRQEADALLRQGAMLKCTVCTVCWPQHTGHL